MKRIPLWILTLALCLPVLSGCAEATRPSDHDTHGSLSDTGITSKDPSLGSPPPGDATPEIANSTFHFDSYEEMLDAFQGKGAGSSSDTIQELKTVMGGAYARFVDKVAEDKAFPKPMLDGSPMPYRNEDGFSNITFFVNEYR